MNILIKLITSVLTSREPNLFHYRISERRLSHHKRLLIYPSPTRVWIKSGKYTGPELTKLTNLNVLDTLDVVFVWPEAEGWLQQGKKPMLHKIRLLSSREMVFEYKNFYRYRDTRFRMDDFERYEDSLRELLGTYARSCTSHISPEAQVQGGGARGDGANPASVALLLAVTLAASVAGSFR